MPCNDDTTISAIPGDWIQKNAPPNATARERALAQKSASKAADEAADQHCSEGGNCVAPKQCLSTRNGRFNRIYEWEEAQIGNLSYIRCKVTAQYHCECKAPPPAGGGGGGGGHGGGEGGGGHGSEDGGQNIAKGKKP